MHGPSAACAAAPLNVLPPPADSGVDCDHPDLQGVCKFGKSFLTDGKKTKQQDGLKAVRDEHGHGTMMAGLIAARGNDVGSVGVLQSGVRRGRELGWHACLVL